MGKNYEYQNGWRDSKYKRFEVIVSKTENDVLKKLESVDNRSAYLVGLVKADLKKGS